MDIIIVGAGLKMPEHLTIEALEALCCSKVIFTIFHEAPLVKSTIEWYAKSKHNSQLEIDVRSLDELYEPNRLRVHNYMLAADTIIKEVKNGRPICYLTQGNPVVFDRVTKEVIKRAEKNGYSYEILSGISSLDTVMSDLRKEIAPGLQIYDSSGLVGQNLKPNVELPCILLQLNVFSTSFISKSKILKEGTLEGLKNYLLAFYPPNHEMQFVISESNYSSKIIYSAKLESLDKVDPKYLSGSCLYIPSLNEPQMDEKFVETMLSRDFFDQNYK